MSHFLRCTSRDPTVGTVLIASSKLNRLTFNAVSQLDKDTSSALATIREWRNSFVAINRVPLELLSLIPTHFPHGMDLFHASSVCRHWRRTFVQHAALWSRLDLTPEKSDLFIKTILKRAKGSALDITSNRPIRANILALLSLHVQQFKTLDLAHGHWRDVQELSEAAAGPLPLLHTLKIRAADFYSPPPEIMDSPTLPLFNGAINLKEFRLFSELSLLNRFVFPNLTTFEYSATPEWDEFPASQLLNFLEATPTLRTVQINFAPQILLDVPRERIIVLPNVEEFAVTEDEPGYKIAAHVSCPSARRTSLIHKQCARDEMPQEVFPASVSWNTIAPQYTASPIDEVVLEIKTARKLILSCSLFFVSPGPAALELGYRMIARGRGEYESGITLGEKYSKVFSDASKAIQNHPLLPNVKRLRIQDSHSLLTSTQLTRVAGEVGRLFKSMGPLEELTLDALDLRPYLAPFFDLPEFQNVEQPDAFPSIKNLTIAWQSREPPEEDWIAAIVEFAKSQHSLGVPFKRVVFRMEDPPVAMAERLKPWVDAVHFYEVVTAEVRDPV